MDEVNLCKISDINIDIVLFAEPDLSIDLEDKSTGQTYSEIIQNQKLYYD